MKNIFTNKYFIILSIITLVILIGILTYNDQRIQIPFVENAVGTVISPFQKAFTYSADGVNSFFEYFGNKKKLTKENEALKQKVSKLENEKRQMESYKEENEELSKMLDLKQKTSDYNMIAARVIAKDSGNWFNSFTINKGKEDGIKVNDPVITYDGLAGCVTDVGTGYSKVISIIDYSSSVGATVTRTKDIGIIDGDINLMDKGLCKLSFSPKSSTLIVGDIIQTSGLGGIYPEGLLIGKISQLKNEKNQYITVSPAVNFKIISKVFVIVGEK